MGDLKGLRNGKEEIEEAGMRAAGEGAEERGERDFANNNPPL
jgi:hypothetical protein